MGAAMLGNVAVKLEPELKHRLEQLSDITHRSESAIIAEAIRDFVELNEWQIQETKDAVNEAERGDFATNEEVGKVFHKWGVNAN
jgi:predicted transcriptional regulator